ncbi:hypothetical protein QOZ80_8BG0668750 [Eleusine coracana subsp. coracana]|nr:hypothetical protein QOZ80_8BG0668750 [Eleusine coracana subsp. coracana]
MASHQRSTSWPSMAHPNEIRIDEALRSISSVISSPSATIEMVCDSLRRLGDVYSSINEVICLHNHQAHGKRLEEEMERSLEVLDLCNTMQESFADLKMTIQELQIVLNRGDLTAAQVKAQSYVLLQRGWMVGQFIDRGKKDHCLGPQICSGAFVKENGHLQFKQVVSYLQIIPSFMRGGAMAGTRVGSCRPGEFS